MLAAQTLAVVRGTDWRSRSVYAYRAEYKPHSMGEKDRRVKERNSLDGI